MYLETFINIKALQLMRLVVRSDQLVICHIQLRIDVFRDRLNASLQLLLDAAQVVAI